MGSAFCRGFALAMFGLFAALTAPAAAKTDTEETRTGFSGLPVPRFVELGKDKVYGRIAPSLDVDVVVVYRRAGLPVKVIAETKDNAWRRVQDHTGRKVWIHRSMLAENRHALTRSAGLLFTRPGPGARPRARLEPGVMARLEHCEADWCRIRTAGYRGWTEREILWGSPVAPQE